MAFTALYNTENDEEPHEERNVKAKEEPLAELNEAFSALPKYFCEIMALPASWCEGLVVDEITVKRTVNGTRSVQLRAKKNLDTIGGNLHTVDAPFAKIDQPGDGESGEQQVSNEARAAILKALHECERYAKGDRSQQLLNFEEGSAALNAQAQMGEEQPALC